VAQLLDQSSVGLSEIFSVGLNCSEMNLISSIPALIQCRLIKNIFGQFKLLRNESQQDRSADFIPQTSLYYTNFLHTWLRSAKHVLVVVWMISEGKGALSKLK
jgi:hypothetical protein